MRFLPMLAGLMVLGGGQGMVRGFRLSPLFLYLLWPFALSIGGAVYATLARAQRRATAEFERRHREHEARETAKAAAIARGAEPGQLMEVAPGSGRGDLSEAEAPGAVSLVSTKMQSQ